MKLKQVIKKYKESKIPKNTIYCHDSNLNPCPYWKQLKYKDEYGEPLSYCKYMKVADTEQSMLLLWDMCKICGVSEDKEEDK